MGQVRDVINGKIVLGAQKEIQEVKNAYAAYERISGMDPYDMRQLKQLHGIMTKYLVEESGEFRAGEEGVFNGEQCIFMAPPARLVPQLVEELFDWMREAKDDVHPLILSSVFHYEFVFIHPFSDGNRYLNLFLLKARSRNSRMNIMRLFPDAMLPVSLQFLLNLCWRR